MKTQLEQEDIDRIAQRVIELIKPMLSGNGKQADLDIIFDKKGLSEYLKVSASTVNKMVSNKQIPHFKIQPGQSGGVRFYRRAIDSWIGRQTIPEIMPVNSKTRP